MATNDCTCETYGHCVACASASADGARLLGIPYSTLCADHRERAVRRFQPVRPSRSKAHLDYSRQG